MPASEPVDPSLTALAVRVARALEACGVPFALGGALAYNYYGVPRSTGDLDFNLFVPEAEAPRLAECLSAAGATIGERFVEQASEEGQVRFAWEDRYVDLFFAYHPLHEECRGRARVVPFAGTSIPILSSEDLTIFKVIFNRSRDWGDIERILGVQGARFDRRYVLRWLDEILGPGDAARQRFAALSGL